MLIVNMYGFFVEDIDMPWGDGTGPMGLGPMTGRAAGYCAGYGVPGYMNPIPGRGWWFGRGRGWFGRGFWGRGGGFGRGFRWRNWYYLTGLPGWARWGAAYPWWPTVGNPVGQMKPEEEISALEEEATTLEEELKGIRSRIEELRARRENE